MGRFEGKVAFITGAARGQGRSHALRLAQEGADIVAVDVCEPIPGSGSTQATPEDLAETVRAVEALDRRIVAARADVRDLDALRAVVDDGVAQLGGLDVVVANAGIAAIEPWDRITAESWSAVIDVNLTGVWHTCAVSIPHLIERGGGAIVLISSTAGAKGAPFLLHYVAAKHGVVGMTKALANELGPQRIRVNCVLPGNTDTPMGGAMATEETAAIYAARPDAAAMLTPALPVGLLDPGDISDGVLFLASDEGRHVTGVSLPVDAGLAAR